MRQSSFQCSARGSGDSTDLVVGVVLLIVVPIACVLIAGAMGVGVPPKASSREKPKVDPPLDAAEADLRFQAAEKTYLENAKTYLDLARNHQSNIYGSRYREWAERSLREAESAYQDLEAMIQRHPDTNSRFGSYVARIGERRAEIAKDFEAARSLDILR